MEMAIKAEQARSMAYKAETELHSEAMKEAEDMDRSPEKYKSYKDVDSMMEDILGEV